MRWILYTLFFLIHSVWSAGIILTQYPAEEITRGSVQTIAWTVPENVTLQSVRVDLYQSNLLKKTLGSVNSDVRKFQWHVSQMAPFGTGYLLKIIGVSSQGKTAWANTPYFSIVDSSIQTIDTAGWVTVACVILVLLGCCMLCRSRQGTRYAQDHYYPSNAPQALPVHYPPTVNPVSTVTYPPVVTNCRSGYSGGTVAGAAVAGALGGALFENAMSHHHHHHSSNDFGGGSFGLTGDDGGGASGGDF